MFFNHGQDRFDHGITGQDGSYLAELLLVVRGPDGSTRAASTPLALTTFTKTPMNGLDWFCTTEI